MKRYFLLALVLSLSACSNSDDKNREVANTSTLSRSGQCVLENIIDNFEFRTAEFESSRSQETFWLKVYGEEGYGLKYDFDNWGSRSGFSNGLLRLRAENLHQRKKIGIYSSKPFIYFGKNSASKHRERDLDTFCPSGTEVITLINSHFSNDDNRFSAVMSWTCLGPCELMQSQLDNY